MGLVLDSQAGPRDSVVSYDIVGNESVRPRNVVPFEIYRYRRYRKHITLGGAMQLDLIESERLE
jgi:hypothetical protein